MCSSHLPSRLIRYGDPSMFIDALTMHSQCSITHPRIIRNSQNNATHARVNTSFRHDDSDRYSGECTGNIGKRMRSRSNGLIDALKRATARRSLRHFRTHRDVFSRENPSSYAPSANMGGDIEPLREYHGRVKSLVSSNASRYAPLTFPLNGFSMFWMERSSANGILQRIFVVILDDARCDRRGRLTQKTH